MTNYWSPVLYFWIKCTPLCICCSQCPASQGKDSDTQTRWVLTIPLHSPCEAALFSAFPPPGSISSNYLVSHARHHQGVTQGSFSLIPSRPHPSICYNPTPLSKPSPPSPIPPLPEGLQPPAIITSWQVSQERYAEWPSRISCAPTHIFDQVIKEKFIKYNCFISPLPFSPVDDNFDKIIFCCHWIL